MQYSYSYFENKMCKYGFNLKKMYGQNFIIDENTINNIVNLSGIDDNTLVIEIGPGAGSLTYKLSKLAQNVLCYEIDTTLKDLLESNLEDLNNVEIIYEDFLKRNVLVDIKKYKHKKLYVVANLPYYVTTPIISKFIDDKIPVDKMVIMVQKEVGNRFKAEPNTKEYNSLSIFLNYYFDIKKIMDVSRNVFIPKPNVDSIVLELKRKEKKYNVKNEKLFFQLVKDSFKQKRKTLKNNLINYDLNKISEVLEKYGLTINVRAENLSIEQFIEMSNNL